MQLRCVCPDYCFKLLSNVDFAVGNVFGSQQSQPAFGSSTSSFGQTQANPFGGGSTNTFGQSSAFGASQASAFGQQSSPAFGASNASPFGQSSSAFGMSIAGVMYFAIVVCESNSSVLLDVR